MNLPAHVVQEAQALAAAGGIDNPITEMNARPLVKSVAIWLVLQGVLNKEDNAGVIARAGELLHNIIPMHLLHVPKGKLSASDFASRVYGFIQNHMTRANSDFRIQVPHDASLNTPMRALETAGIVERLGEGEVPPQGHSGSSILGKKKQRLGLGDMDGDLLSPPELTPRGFMPPPNGLPTPDEGVPGSSQQLENEIPSAGAQLYHRSGQPLSVPAMLTELARHAGLDVTVAPPARSAEASSLPPVHTGTTESESSLPAVGDGPSKRAARKKAAAPRAAPAAPRAAPAAPRAATAAAPTVEPPADSPAFPFERSKICAPVRAEGEITAGGKLAYYLELPANKGGHEWFVGEVIRTSRGHWVDVSFSDGKLWLSCKPSERGQKWVLLA